MIKTRANARRAVPRSKWNEALSAFPFWWATGIEDTFITATEPRTGRSLDEYALTDHYARWREDLGLMAELGVGTARYGIPWHRVNPEPNRWEWDWVDRALDTLLGLGIDPLVDLVHYGTPVWLEGAFLNPDFPARMAEYAGRLAERFKGRIYWYTPLNEPRITAWYCGRLGWWPPFRQGTRGFVALLVAIARGIVQTCQTLIQVDPEIVLLHVDATDLYWTSDDRLQAEATRRQQVIFLPLDLVSGRVSPAHPLYEWLVNAGATETVLREFTEKPIALDMVGLNLYPMFTYKRLVQSSRGVRVRMLYGTADLVTQLGQMYWNRYRRPMMITETASLGSIQRRRRWLHDSAAAVRELRAAGIPMVGYTWWPLFSLVAWAYRQGQKGIDEYLLNMGLWDLDPETLDRIPTPLVQEFRQEVNNS